MRTIDIGFYPYRVRSSTATERDSRAVTLSNAASNAVHPDPHRVAEVIARGEGRAALRGSGYLVADRYVLTAAHVIDGASEINVRFDADLPTEWSAPAEAEFVSVELDIALLGISASAVPAGRAEPTPTEFGTTGDRPVECEAIGYPLFMLKSDPERLAPGGGSSAYRDSFRALGFAAPLSNLADRTYEVVVQAPRRSPYPGYSPWSGMSGAALWSSGRLIGLIGRHAADDGPGTLTAYRVDGWYRELARPQIDRLHELIGLPQDVDELPILGAEPRYARPLRPPNHLPPSPARLSGREPELRALVALAESTSQRPTVGAPVVCAIDGMGGVGKTALAVSAGYAVQSRFPDGVLFLDLHGYTDGIEPADLRSALLTLLRQLRVPQEKLPDSPEECAALYRDTLAASRTLIVLDNASGTARVRPLIPNASGCLVVVTSRRHLTGLDDANPVSLSPLDPETARELFRVEAGSRRVPEGHPALGELVGLCGHLPLAIQVAAARLRNRPALTVEILAAQLRDERNRLAGLEVEDEGLRAVFELSYRHLPEAERRLFRSLGLVAGADFDAYGAARLDDVGSNVVRRRLEDLIDHNLLIRLPHARYRFHDLLRAYARSLLPDPNGVAGQADWAESALRRLHGYYLSAALRADRLLLRRTLRLSPYTDTAPEPDMPEIENAEDAASWFSAERANILATLERYPRTNPSTPDFSAVLAQYLRLYGPWVEARGLHARARDAARLVGDRHGEALALAELGIIEWVTSDYAASRRRRTITRRCWRRPANRGRRASSIRWRSRSPNGSTPGTRPSPWRASPPPTRSRATSTAHEMSTPKHVRSTRRWVPHPM